MKYTQRSSTALFSLLLVLALLLGACTAAPAAVPAADDAAEDEVAGDAGTSDATDPEPPGSAPGHAAIRAEVLAHVSAVIDLCALAGLPLQARRFLESGSPLDEVRAALLAARAEATPEVTALHPQPGRSADARPWGEVIARTFKQRG
jgi:hypothetical protein